MKKLLFGFLFFVVNSVFFVNISFASRCDDVISSADDALTYANRAIRETNLDDLHRYAKKTYSEAEYAYDYASDCECDDAASSADDAMSYARRAFRNDDIDDAERYMKYSRNALDDTISYAEDCR